MRPATGWQDYELLDATDGFRLERWNQVLLQRPDPQVVWRAPPKSEEWNKVDAVYHRSSRGGGYWEYKRPLPEKWDIHYDNLTFIVSPTGFKHTGVFPEQAANWNRYSAMVKRDVAAGYQPKVLNLFGYTGGATLACSAAGASLSHVDASRGVVGWARQNASKSGLEARPIRWIVDDCQKFVAREIRRGNRYDAIIMDPPSYGRGPAGEVWKIEESLWPLLELAAQCLSDDPLFFAVSNYTAGLAPGVMAYMLQTLLVPRFGGKVSGDEIGLPVTATGGVLPCGATAVWELAT